MKETELAYAAGIFDGEGSVFMTGRTHGCTVIAKVTNTDKRLCEFFLRWGGHIQSEPPHSYGGKNTKTIHKWQANGRRAKDFFLAMQPFSIHKAELISLALLFIDTVGYTHLDTELATKRAEIVKAIYKANK